MSETILHTVLASDVEDVLTIITSRSMATFLKGNNSTQKTFDLGAQHRAFAIEGQALCHALITHLPGGLFDALLGAMLAAKASILHVAHVQETTE